MNRTYSAIAVSALALGATALTATDASAREGPEPNYPEYKLDVPTSPTGPAEASEDDTGAEALQAGASALGGAGLAFGAMWLYRRRHAPAI